MTISSCGQTLPLQQWIRGKSENPGACRSCLLVDLAVQYEQVIRSSGQTDQADRYHAFLESSAITPLKVAKRMDQVKAEVPEELRTKLQGLDCSLQMNERSL